MVQGPSRRGSGYRDAGRDPALLSFSTVVADGLQPMKSCRRASFPCPDPTWSCLSCAAGLTTAPRCPWDQVWDIQLGTWDPEASGATTVLSHVGTAVSSWGRSWPWYGGRDHWETEGSLPAESLFKRLFCPLPSTKAGRGVCVWVCLCVGMRLHPGLALLAWKRGHERPSPQPLPRSPMCPKDMPEQQNSDVNPVHPLPFAWSLLSALARELGGGVGGRFGEEEGVCWESGPWSGAQVGWAGRRVCLAPELETPELS